MEHMNQKCNFKEHKEIDAIIYCNECRINMCNKCSLYHKGLFENHYLINLNNENIENIFTGFCQELNHPNKLNYFCKSHNKLCCANCIVKIVQKGDGQHKDCDVCTIEDISEEKKNKLKDNINYLENISKDIEKKIEEIKQLFQMINNNKEELKLQVQKIFTILRTKLNEREDELLNKIDEQYNKYCGDENIIKESEKLPNKIKISLEKGNLINNEWDNDNNDKNNELNSKINDCINIENNIKDILAINENIKKIKDNNEVNFIFIPEEKGINQFIEQINQFGDITAHENNYENNHFKFRESPLDKNNKLKYTITGDNKNILTKIEKQEWIGILSENVLKKPKEYKWKIKILKNQHRWIRVGIVPKDYDINLSGNYSCGWCFYDYYHALYSGPPHNYNGKESNLSHITNEIFIVVNTEKGTMKFIIDKVDQGDSFTNISFDTPYVPIVFLYGLNDSVEVTVLT